MSLGDEKLRKIAEFREFLEERVMNLEKELEGLRVLLEFVNKIILDQSFKRVEELKPSAVEPEVVQPQPSVPPTVIPLKAADGEVLADMYVEGSTVRIVPHEGKDFNVNTPPFVTFFVDKVLTKMQERDREAVKKGELSPSKMFSFNIRRDGVLIREITIRNVSPNRRREVKSAIRWTLEKMYEKTKRT